MPLHLLGKKSWNVYNQDNIERVKRDEAAAAAREAAEEQRMQEVDAERRIQVLRGIQPTAIAATPSAVDTVAERGEPSQKRERKRRRIAGEDDTDRDLRYAREDQEAKNAPKADLQLTHKKTSDAPLMDRRGHIDLFPMGGSRHNAPKNAEVEAEKAKKKKEFEDQYTMRFSNAAGFKQSIGDKPWYQSTGTGQDDAVDAPSKDVWGNEDPRRKERERRRVAADDPMAAIQKGVTQLRQVERERKQWREERDRETGSLADADRRSVRKTKRKHEDDGLEGFNLDAPMADDINTIPPPRYHQPVSKKPASRRGYSSQKQTLPATTSQPQDSLASAIAISEDLYRWLWLVAVPERLHTRATAVLSVVAGTSPSNIVPSLFQDILGTTGFTVQRIAARHTGDILAFSVSDEAGHGDSASLSPLEV